MKILLLDNYDSFTWNLVHYLIMSGANTDVLKNDEDADKALQTGEYNGILLGPGPCTPAEAGCMMQVISDWSGKIPMLGVCLGHQALGMHFGWTLSKAENPVHGKANHAIHNGQGLFEGISNPMQIGRYHSLIVKEERDSSVHPVAWCGREVMALQHEEWPVWGVQFHPESVLTTDGLTLLKNWIQMVAKY